VIHLIAIAGRIGVPLCLDDFERLGSALPCLVNLQPSGKYLMEDFFYAGGLPAVLRELGQAAALHRDALTVNGKSMWENVAEAPCWNRDVIHTFAEPFKPNAGITVLRGNLAPDGAVIKLSAASPNLLQHRGRAVVFENIEEFHARINDESLDIDANCVMVLKNCGPRGYPGMAEVGNMPHEWHRLRHGRPTHLPGSRSRRPFGAGPIRRHDHFGCEETNRSTRCGRRHAHRPQREVDASTASEAWMGKALR
jgi:dihydroxy-acid dehydratase